MNRSQSQILNASGFVANKLRGAKGAWDDLYSFLYFYLRFYFCDFVFVATKLREAKGGWNDLDPNFVPSKVADGGKWDNLHKPKTHFL